MKHDYTTKALNVKNMKETLVNYCGGDENEFNRIWDTFRSMAVLGFISNEAWSRFFASTKGWRIEGDYLVDDNKNGEIVFDFDNGARNDKEYEEYRA